MAVKRDYGTHRGEYLRNRKKILARESCCKICGQPVDKTLKYPNPMSASVDHIIPVDRGGHLSDLNNLQLTHLICNEKKSNRLPRSEPTKELSNNRILPLSFDWTKYCYL